jgi:hypothetical protein
LYIGVYRAEFNKKAYRYKLISKGSYLTVTDFARFLGLSILFPRESAK